MVRARFFYHGKVIIINAPFHPHLSTLMLTQLRGQVQLLQSCLACKEVFGKRAEKIVGKVQIIQLPGLGLGIRGIRIWRLGFRIQVWAFWLHSLSWAAADGE